VVSREKDKARALICGVVFRDFERKLGVWEKFFFGAFF